MWNSAGEPTATYSGVVQRPGPGGRPMIVAVYRHDGSDELDFLPIPTESDGRPSPPFEYQGPRATVGRMWAAVSPQQRAAVIDRGRAEGVDSAVDASTLQHDRVYDEAERDRLVAVPYLVRSDGSFEFVDVGGRAAHTSDAMNRITLPPGGSIALVPAKTARPPAAIDLARARAALLTPLTVAADAVLTPAYVVGGVALFVFFVGPKMLYLSATGHDC